MILQMISVNQGIGTCVPEKLEKGGLMMFYINGQGGGGGVTFKWERGEKN